MSEYFEKEELRSWIKEQAVIRDLGGQLLIQKEGEWVDLIDEAPTADAVKQKHGHWQKVKSAQKLVNTCSRCGAVSRKETPCCWYCGAQMDEVSE